MSTYNSLFDFSTKEYTGKFNGKTLACACHCHSHDSVDGASTIEELARKMSEVGMTHMTITEHGNLNSAAAVHRICSDAKKGHGLKVVHGVEGYIYWPEDKKPDATYHITIWFKTREAFEAYCRITPDIFSPPRIKVVANDTKGCMYWEDFLKLAEHDIVIGTGCVGSWLNKPIANEGNVEEAKRRLDMMIEAVGVENIYDEWIVDDLSYDYQSETDDHPARLVMNECKPWFLHPCIGRETNKARWSLVTGPKGIKRLASQDAHYAEKRNKVVQDNKRYGSDWIMSMFQHIKGADEFAELAKATHEMADRDIEELIDNTHEFVENFSGYEFLTSRERGFMIPRFEGDARETLLSKIESVGRCDLNDKDTADRINYEMEVLSSSPKLDGLSYMLLASDIAETANQNDILVNTRGSAGGSLLAYGIGLSLTDPVKYGLQFERFLTKGRIAANTPPDIDIDCSSKDLLLSKLKEKYGGCIIPISTNSLLKPRSAIKDVERFLLGSVRTSTEIMTKKMETVPQGVEGLDWLLGYEKDGEHVLGAIETNDELKQYSEDNPEIWSMVLEMCGIMRQKSQHACGILVASQPVHHFMPLYRVGGKDGVLCTGYEPKDVEYVGGLKVDLLGVTAMDTVDTCLKLIEQRTGQKPQFGYFPHDEKVYENVYWNGKTEATFQTKTEGITALCEKTKPFSIVQLSNLIALYRPGCLDWNLKTEEFDGNAVDFYVKASRGEISPYFIHRDLEPIFGDTYGVPLFQEQILRCARDIAGKSYEEAEALRRAIGKKDAKAMLEFFTQIADACYKRGWTKDQIDELKSMIMASSRYSFNCIDGEQLIHTTDGLIRMEEIANNYTWYKVLSIDEFGHACWITPSFGKKMGTKKVLEVSIINGDTIRATEDHRFMSNGEWQTLVEIIDGVGFFDSAWNTELTIKAVSVIGVRDVYDIEIPGNHNFVLANGAIAHNCAHSTSYGIVSYQTAYLKHHYPLEFWCAELTTEADNEDKLRQYSTVLGDMLIHPSITRSDSSKWLIDDNKLIAPLKILKGCGETTCDSILQFLSVDSFEELGLTRIEEKVEEIKQTKRRKVRIKT